MNGRRGIYFARTNAFRLPTFLNGWTQAEVFVVLRSFGPTTNPPTGLWFLCSGSGFSRYPDSTNAVWENFGLADGLIETERLDLDRRSNFFQSVGLRGSVS
jgi:hypothetical protein